VIAELVAPPKQKRRGRDGKLRSVPAKLASREPPIEPAPEQPKQIAKKTPPVTDDVMRRPRAMKWPAYLKNRIADLKAELADLRAECQRLIDFERDDPEKIASALMAMPEDRRHQLQRQIDNVLGPRSQPETRADIADTPEPAQKGHGRPADRRRISRPKSSGRSWLRARSRERPSRDSLTNSGCLCRLSMGFVIERRQNTTLEGFEIVPTEQRLREE
jgi:hypothetical protein